MINTEPLIKIKSLFFDKAGVVNKVDKATRSVLSKFGAFVRTTAKSSIRKRKKPSAPGSPPSSHVGLLKKFIFFSYEPESQNVVIGPVLLSSKKSGGSTTIPQVLEYGGRTQRIFWDDKERKRKSKNVTIRQRPFMHPAFDKELPKLPAMWRDSVK